MRMMLKVKMDTEAASRAIEDGSLPKLLEETMERLQPEAAYFGPEGGVRTAFIIFDLKDPSDIPRFPSLSFAGRRRTSKCFRSWIERICKRAFSNLSEPNSRPRNRSSEPDKLRLLPERALRGREVALSLSTRPAAHRQPEGDHAEVFHLRGQPRVIDPELEVVG